MEWYERSEDCSASMLKKNWKLVAIRLISCLERLLGKGNSMTSQPLLEWKKSCADLCVPDGQNDLLLVSTLDLLLGILLIHPPSRSLFSRELYMNVRLPIQLLPIITGA